MEGGIRENEMFMEARVNQVNYISFVMHADLCRTENCGREAAAAGGGHAVSATREKFLVPANFACTV